VQSLRNGQMAEIMDIQVCPSFRPSVGLATFNCALRPVARSLTADAAKTIVHAFIARRLDYCNSLLHGITDSLFRWLQSVQNAAACLITGTRRHDHITPVLRDVLHWLPVQHRVDYKLALL